MDGTRNGTICGRETARSVVDRLTFVRSGLSLPTPEPSGRDFAKASGLSAVTYDVTYFPHADDAEVEYQLKQLARDLEISVEVIRDVCADEIAEYIKLDAERDASLPVHSIVECYTGGTAFAWYGMNPYPRLKRVVLGKLAAGGKKAEKAFVLRASKAQVDYLGDY